MEIRRAGALKILLVNYEYPPLGGGAANATFSIGKALAKLGHEPTVLTSAFAQLAQSSDEDGVSIVRIPAIRNALDRSNPIEMASFLCSALWRVRRIAEERCIQGVIAFFTIPCGPVAWLLKRSLGLPYVVSLRGGDVPGMVRGLDAVHWALTPFRRAALRGARAVVANSESLARLSESADPVPVRVIPNGVDSDFFAPDPHIGAMVDPVFRILFVGRLHEQKNVAMLLRELADLRERRITPMQVDIVGDGPLQKQLAELAQTLGLSGQVVWHRWCGKEQVASMYRHASCFVNPSFYEGMPNTVLEAMASGLPVVASDIGGHNELVVPGVTGFLFDLAKPGELHRCLIRLSESSELRQTVGAAARRAVLARHSWVRVASEYVDLLQEPALVSARRPNTSPPLTERKNRAFDGDQGKTIRFRRELDRVLRDGGDARAGSAGAGALLGASGRGSA
jgi:glycosyltransferase involved in cell wall biosynthesis